jgi:hypothetical protein
MASVFFLIIRAEDGEHIRRFATASAAYAALKAQVGYEIDPAIPANIVDDWGRRLAVEEWPAETSLKDRRGLRDAYDARECGTLTKAQAALLNRLRA